MNVYKITTAANFSGLVAQNYSSYYVPAENAMAAVEKVKSKLSKEEIIDEIANVCTIDVE